MDQKKRMIGETGKIRVDVKEEQRGERGLEKGAA